MTPGLPDPFDQAPVEPPLPPSRTSRLQRVLFWSLLGGIALMSILLFREHRAEEQRYTNLNEITPLSAPYVDTETVTFDMADDATGSIRAVQQDVALPQNPVIRARALLDRLFVEYALPNSAHPLPTSAAIDELFLVDLSALTPKPADKATHPETVKSGAPRLTTASSSSHGDAGITNSTLYPTPGAKLAIVSLRGAFVQNHPSGIAVEDLTLRSIIGTLHANNPDIQQVRFLVDGQPRDTLAGHADLSRTYPATDTASTPIQPTANDSSDSPTNPQ